MNRHARSCLPAILLCAAAILSACGQGAYLLVEIQPGQGKDPPSGIRRIDLLVDVDGAASRLTLEEPGSKEILLPTSATLDLGASTGAFLIQATALDGSGAELGKAEEKGHARPGESATVTLSLSRAAASPPPPPPVPVLSADRTSFDLGTAILDQLSALPATSITITNTGTGASGPLSILLDGKEPPQSGAAGPFYRSDDTCAGIALQPGAGCTISLVFQPRAQGAVTAKLTAAAAPGGVVEVRLTGTGVAPGALKLSPLARVFDATVEGLASGEVEFAVKNTGESPTGAVAVAMTGSGAGEFAITSDSCKGLALSQESTCLVKVRFRPQSPGDKSATLTAGASPGGTAVASLSGGALSKAALRITPSTRDLGQVTVGASSAEFLFEVENLGDQKSGPIEVVLKGSEFSITSDGECRGQSLSKGGSCTIRARFTPTSAGAKTGSIAVSAGPGGTSSATLNGTGLTPGSVSVDPLAYDFGVIDVGSTSASRSFTIRNSGGSATGALAVSLDAMAPFQIETNLCQGKVLGSGATCTVGVRFKPPAFGVKNATLRVSGMPGGATTASLAGTGRDKVTLDVSVKGKGTVTAQARGDGPSCASSCQWTYTRTTANPSVELTATQAFGASFKGWSGACTGTRSSCTVVLSANKAVTALFSSPIL